MTETELRQFIDAMTRLRAKNTSTPERARRFLKDEGFLTEDGDVAEPYALQSDPPLIA